MASSILPTLKHVRPYFNRLPQHPYRMRSTHRISFRILCLAFVSIIGILIASLQGEKTNLETPRRRQNIAALHLAEAARYDFRHTNESAARTTKLFHEDDLNIRILIDMCRIPPVFVSRLNVEGRQRVLGRLTKNSNGIPLWSVMPRVFMIDLQNGLGNRMRALASAMEFAYVTGRILVVVWTPDAHINARMTDLFDREVLDNLIVIEEAIPWPLSQNDVLESENMTSHIPSIASGHPALSSFAYYNFMSKDIQFQKSNGRNIFNSASRHIYVKTAYLVESKHLRHKLVNVLLQALVPSQRVMQLVYSVERRIGGAQVLRGMVGVHIRSRTIVGDNKAVDHECEYSVDGAQTTDKWRQMSTPKQFIPEMKRIERQWGSIVHKSTGLEAAGSWSKDRSVALATSDHDPSNFTSVDIRYAPKFFMCVDSVDTLDELAGHFPRNRLVSLPRKCDDRGAECIIYAFADLVLLSRTGAMLTSGWSSFSEVALRMRRRQHGIHPSSNDGYHVRVSGQNFGQPSAGEKLAHQLRKFVQRFGHQRVVKEGMTQSERLELCKWRYHHDKNHK